MSKRYLYSMLFLVVYLLGLLALIPANYLIKQLSPYAPQLEAVGVSGTLWQGSVQHLTVDAYELENLSWSLSPFPLLLGQAKIDFISVSAEQSIEGVASVGLSGDSIELNQLRVRFPLTQYAHQLQIAEFDLTGQIELQLDYLQYQLGVLDEGKGALIWRQAGMGDSLQLGDIQLDWQLQEGKVDGQLSDLDGPVEIEGSLDLSGAGQYQLNAQFEVKDNSDVSLKQTIRLFGRSIGENRVQLEKDGVLMMPAGLRLQ